MEIALWAACIACSLLALSGYALTARTKGAWREPASWCGPLAFTSAAVALLTGAGAIGVLAGALLAPVPLLALTAMLVPAWRDVAREKGAAAATRAILARVGGRLLDALWNAREDARDLASRLRSRPEPGTEEQARPAPAPPVAATRPVPPPAATRPVPAPGPAPAAPPPAGGGVPGPLLSPGWTGLCTEIDGFEGETDDEVLGFIAAQLAGHAAHAESVRDLADRLLHGTGLDPAFAQGVATYADENADMTGSVAMLDRMFRGIYDALRAWADEHPMGMPHRAREFLQGEQPQPEAGDDGQAAA